MKYSLVYTRHAARDIPKLPPQVKKRIGEYRVIFDIENSDIVILRIGHRKDIYNG